MPLRKQTPFFIRTKVLQAITYLTNFIIPTNYKLTQRFRQTLKHDYSLKLTKSYRTSAVKRLKHVIYKKRIKRLRHSPKYLDRRQDTELNKNVLNLTGR